VLTTRLILFAAPLGYLALTGYLLSKVMPLPLVLLPAAAPEDERVRARIAA